MFHFNSKSSSVKKRSAVARARTRSKQSDSVEQFITKSSSLMPTGMSGVNQSNQQTKLDLTPLLSGFLYNKEDKNFIDTYKDIYYYDSVAGTTVDFMSTLPFSEFSLSGFNNEEVQKPAFLESLDRLNIKTLLPELSIDYLVTGNFVGSLIFDDAKKIFVDIIPQDFKNIEIQTLPFYGFDPIIEVTYPKEVVALFNSKNPRIKAVLDTYGSAVVSKIKSGFMELDPISTIYVPRRTMTGTEGISFYRRILPIYFLEKNIFRGTLMESIKRQRSILHITMGDADWEPNEEDLDYITELFTSADADPLGAIIATRNGVQTSEVRDPASLWSIGQLWSETVPAKLRALGVSEAFLSGESNFNVVDAAITTFMENLQDYRSKLTRKVFYDRIFPLISLVNEFYPDDASKEKVDEIRRKSVDGSVSNLMYQIQDTSNLIIPTVEWEKNLKPAGDEALLSQLGTLKDMGVPIPLRIMAAAGGLNLDSLLAGKEEDIKTQREAAGWRKAIETLGPSEDMFSSGSSTGNSDLQSLLTAYRDFPDKVKAQLLSDNPHKSSVLNTNKVHLSDRDFGEASEAFTVDAHGKKHYPMNQKKAQDTIDNHIYKSLRERKE